LGKKKVLNFNYLPNIGIHWLKNAKFSTCDFQSAIKSKQTVKVTNILQDQPIYF
jgi:hypothetical protein